MQSLHSAAVLCRDVTAFLDRLFPQSLAEGWDASGLQVGDLDKACNAVLVGLDLELEHLDSIGDVDLVITHHPLLFRPLQTVRPQVPVGKKLRALLSHGVACYAIHTPYDIAHGGLGELLVRSLGLRETRPLVPRGRLLKLVTFVPSADTDAVADALFAAGAGHIGGYSRCAFRVEGTGTFLPGEGTSPYLGLVGQEERASEIRLETIVPAELGRAVIEALDAAHPYEEVAYDLYPLEQPSTRHGLGRVGTLPEPRPAEDVVEAMRRFLGVQKSTECYGHAGGPVTTVAVCGGSGGGLWREALAAGAELMLTGEASYHEGMEAAESGLAVVCLGHRASEMPFVGHIRELLREVFPGLVVVSR